MTQMEVLGPHTILDRGRKRCFNGQTHSSITQTGRISVLQSVILHSYCAICRVIWGGVAKPSGYVDVGIPELRPSFIIPNKGHNTGFIIHLI